LARGECDPVDGSFTLLESSVVRPVRPFVRSARAWRTQFASDDGSDL